MNSTLPHEPVFLGAGVSPQRPFAWIGELAGFLRRCRTLLLACLAATVLLALCYLATATPRFTAVATLMVDAKQADQIQQRPAVSDAQIENALIESEVEVLRSAGLARKAVAELGLANDPAFVGRPSAFSRLAFLLRRPISVAAGWCGHVDRGSGPSSPAVPGSGGAAPGRPDLRHRDRCDRQHPGPGGAARQRADARLPRRPDRLARRVRPSGCGLAGSAAGGAAGQGVAGRPAGAGVQVPKRHRRHRARAAERAAAHRAEQPADRGTRPHRRGGGPSGPDPADDEAGQQGRTSRCRTCSGAR